MGSLKEAWKEEGGKREGAALEEAGEPVHLEAPKPRVKNNKTFEQIRNDSVASSRFMRFLEKNVHTELEEMILVAEEHPERIDRRAMEKLITEKENFLALMERADDVAKNLDQQTIVKLAETIPELKNVLEWGGPQRIREALQRKLPDIAIQDADRFEYLAKGAEDFSNEGKSGEKLEGGIKTTFKKWGIKKDQEIARLLHGDDPGEIALEIAEKMADEKFEETWSWRKIFKLGPRVKTIREFEEQIRDEIKNFADESNEDLRRHEANLTYAMQRLAMGLEGLMMENQEIHDAVITSVYGKNTEATQTISMKEASEAMKLNSDEARAEWENRLNNRRERNQGSYVSLKTKEWKEEQREKAWEEGLKAQIKNEARKRVEEEGGEINEEGLNAKESELTENFNNLSEEEKERLHDAFFKDYVDPLPPMNLIEEWQSDAPDIGDLETGFLADNFINEYTDEHMARYTQGKKPGFVSRAVSEFFKDALFRDLFRSL